MEKWTFNMTFFCKKAKINKKGKAPIYARVTTSGQAVEIYTQCLIAPEHWDQRAERSLCRDAVSVQINSIVASYRANILAVEYGMPIDVLAKILGHTNTNMTRHYAKFSEKLIGKEMMKIGQVFG